MTLQAGHNRAHHDIILERLLPGMVRVPSRAVPFHLIRDAEKREETEQEEINGNVCFQQIREDFH